MATVEVTIPRMLADLVRGPRSFTVEGETVDGVLASVIGRHPELRVHIFDEQATVRRHVSCFHNDAVVRDGSAPVTDGDRLVILQAVSGG